MFNKTGIYSVVPLTALMLACIACPLTLLSQFSNHGASISISARDTLSVKGNFSSSASILGNGTVMLSGDAVQQLNMQGNSLSSLLIGNAQLIRLTGGLAIERQLFLEQGFMSCEDQLLTLSDSAQINGYAENRFIITNGTGAVLKKGLGPANQSGYLFPVGFSVSEYNPIHIINTGITDDFSVRVTENAFGTPGSANDGHLVRNSWIVEEAVSGGSMLNLTAGWQATDEPSSFNHEKSGIARYSGDQRWDLPSNGIGIPGSGNYYTRSRSDIDSAGIFAIADSSMANRALLHLTVFLQGAYTGTGIMPGLMKDQLRSSQAIPYYQPYNGGLYTHVGLQGGTESVNPAVFNPGSEEKDDIVDWVFVSLLDANNPAQVEQTRAALLQRDGDIVDLDGLSALSMPINKAGQYMVGVGHRNHLRIRTPDAMPLNLSTGNQVATWDFSSGSSQAYQNPQILSNEAMLPVTQGSVTRYCMIGGNTDGLTQNNSNAKTVMYSGSGNDRNNILVYGLNGISTNTAQVTMYNYEDIGMYDLNMDGRIIYSRDSNDPAVIMEALGSNTAVAAREHY